MDIILASTSPRRIDLLTQAGFTVKTMRPSADERKLPHESPRQMVARLAKLKGMSVAKTLDKSARKAIVISADTIVLDPIDASRVLGKPRNKAHAFSMLKRLTGQTHTVLTGYCLLWDNGRHCRTRVVSSRVCIRELSDAAIKKYVRTGEPMDKAGAYAAQGKGMALIEKISGSYTNVVGLPLSQVIADMERIWNRR